MKRRTIGLLALCSLLALSGCATQRNGISQIATLQSLVQGYYDGTVSVKDLKSLGDTGIGTFENVDGELIMLGGVVYQAKADGTIVKASDDVSIPFATVSFFQADETFALAKVPSLSSLSTLLDEHIGTEHRNGFAMVRITGSFSSVRYRSEYPVPEGKGISLDAWLAGNQVEWTREKCEGTIVAVYFPDYFDGLNVPGWHFHYLASGKDEGGHLLDLELDEATVEMDYLSSFYLLVPEDPAFMALPLQKDVNAHIQKIEK